MKRITAILALVLALSSILTACGQSLPQKTEPEKTESENISKTKEETQTMTTPQKPDPATDDTLNILMIGSSFCYYYVEELYGMLKAAGIRANVCNVYYSGCPLEKHWNWWKLGEAHYEYFITNDGGRQKTPDRSLEWCLKQKNWDIISLQESTSKIFNVGAEKHLETSKRWRTDLWKHLKEQFPQSRYFWHQPWTYQIGTASNGYVMKDAAQQQGIADEIRAYAVAVCEELDLERVNTGDAWQITRNEHGYDKLCARIGKGVNNEGDYYHDGDVGGGQYLNACVWFEILTGQSCVGNSFRPKYVLDGKDLSLTEEKINLLQNTAHQAVAEFKAN